MDTLEGIWIFRNHRDHFGERIDEPIGCGGTGAGVPRLRVSGIPVGERAKDDREHGSGAKLL